MAPWCLGYATQVIAFVTGVLWQTLEFTHCSSRFLALISRTNSILAHTLSVCASAATCSSNQRPPSPAEGKFTLDDLPEASRNIAQAEMRGEFKDAKRLEQLVAHWAGAPPKEDKFKCGKTFTFNARLQARAACAAVQPQSGSFTCVPLACRRIRTRLI